MMAREHWRWWKGMEAEREWSRCVLIDVIEEAAKVPSCPFYLAELMLWWASKMRYWDRKTYKDTVRPLWYPAPLRFLSYCVIPFSHASPWKFEDQALILYSASEYALSTVFGHSTYLSKVPSLTRTFVILPIDLLEALSPPRTSYLSSHSHFHLPNGF